jgi:hypothetical protein
MVLLQGSFYPARRNYKADPRCSADSGSSITAERTERGDSSEGGQEIGRGQARLCLVQTERCSDDKPVAGTRPQRRSPSLRVACSANRNEGRMELKDIEGTGSVDVMCCAKRRDSGSI